MKPTHAISANFLERIAQPDSCYHTYCLAYRKGEITWNELINRLPHVAMIGDSLSRNVYVSSPWSTFWRARRDYANDWFLNSAPSSNGIYSLFQRLEKFRPLCATEYAGLGAMVDGEKDRQNLFRRILGTRNFSGQMRQLLATKRFADLILIWIGHNNVDWAWRCPADEFQNPEKRLLRLSKRFREDFTRQLRWLIARAEAVPHRVAIVVFGLADFESFFTARDIAESMRENDSTLYPYLGADHKYFISMRPAYREHLIRLVEMVNEALREMIDELAIDQSAAGLQVRYSDALANVDLSAVEVIHAVDGWHPSAHAHNLFAQAAFDALEPSLRFLGMK